MSLSSTIRAARLRAGLTQAQAAEKLGVSQPQWAQWESAAPSARTPQLGRLERIAEALDCELVIELQPRSDT